MAGSLPKARAGLSQAELQSQREALRRGLWRASVASIVILLVVVALALGVVWKAGQSSRAAERARAATARAEAELWNSKLSEARARRIAGGPGARIDSEALIRELVRRPNLDDSQLLALRQEAIAQMALVDVIPPTNWIPKSPGLHWDHSLTRYVRHGDNASVDVCEYPSGSVLGSFRHPANAVPRMSLLTPDGRLLATRFSGSDVLVWAVESQKLFLKSRCERPFGFPLVVAPDSGNLLMLTETGLLLQPLQTNSAARPLQPGRLVYNAAFTHDGRRLAVCLGRENGIIEVWDVATGAVLQRFDAGFSVWTVDWHPDGRRLAVSGDHGRLGIWDTEPFQASPGTNAPRETLRLEGHIGAVTSTIFTPDGSFLTTHAWDSVSGVWDVTSGRRLLAETRVALYGYGFNQTGDRIVGHAGNDLTEGVCSFSTRTGFRTVACTGKPRPVNGIFLSPDSRLLVIAYPKTQDLPEGECSFWDFQRGVELTRVPGVWAQFSEDSQALFVYETKLLRRYELGSDPTTGNARMLKGEILYRDFANAGSLSADGRTLTIGSGDHVVLLDVKSNSPPRKIAGRAHDAALSADGTLLATRFQNAPAQLQNPTNGAVILKIKGVVEFVFSPDDKWIAGSGIDKVRLLARDTLKTVREIPLEVSGGLIAAIAFTPDSSAIAIAYNRFDVQLIDIATGRQLATFSAPHPSQINASRGLSFSHDGRNLLAARADGEVTAWHLPTVRRELSKLGLDWAPGPNAPGIQNPATLGEESQTGANRRFSVLLVCVAAACAVLAGLFVFFHQRQSIASYARVETLALEQQQKLQTAQDQLLQSQKMRALGTLAAGVAHDFNNLLSVIQLSNELAAEQLKPGGAARENMNAIDTAVAEGENIVQSMLGYSRAAAELDQEYSISAAMSEMVAMLGKKFLSGIILKLEIQPDLPPVCGARGRLEQMLLNLVVNASEAMNGQGTLRLSAMRVPKAANCLLKPREASNYIELQIADSGPGIPAEILPRIFEPFFTTKHASNRPGTGLGLATVYMMAEQDGLGLEVETCEGRGTTFRILIPVDSPNPKSKIQTPKLDDVGATNPVQIVSPQHSV